MIYDSLRFPHVTYNSMRSILSATRTIPRQVNYRSKFQASSLPILLQRSYAMGHSVPPLNDKSLLKSQTYVNGKWIDAKSGKTFEVTGTATPDSYSNYSINISCRPRNRQSHRHNARIRPCRYRSRYRSRLRSPPLFSQDHRPRACQNAAKMVPADGGQCRGPCEAHNVGKR